MPAKNWSDVVDTPTDSEEEGPHEDIALPAGNEKKEFAIVKFTNSLLITDYNAKCRWRYFLSQKGFMNSELPMFVSTTLLVEFLIFNTLSCNVAFKKLPRIPLTRSLCYFAAYLPQCEKRCCNYKGPFAQRTALAHHITQSMQWDRRIALRWRAFLQFHNLNAVGVPFYACIHMLQAFRLVLHPDTAVCTFCGQKLTISMENRLKACITNCCIL